jgi:peptide/nickel transport system permease protein
VTGFVIRRLGQTIIVTILVTMATFGLLHLLPGGPVHALLGIKATPQQIAHFNAVYGYDKPVYVQYAKWIWALLHGNLGYSYKMNQSVGSILASYAPKTIVLIGIAIVVSLIFGVPLGIYQAVHRNTVSDYTLTTISFIGYATPYFFIGILLIQWFAVKWHLLPAEAPQSSTVWGILSDPAALIMPVFTLAFLGYASWSRFMRSSVLDNIVQDYVRTARAKGASERRVLWGHIFRNSLITIVTLLGLSLPGLVGGAVIVEDVFNYPGMGWLFIQAANTLDFDLMLGIVLIGTVLTILGNLFADIGYAVLDPRVRYS